jgi:hypothetical protein
MKRHGEETVLVAEAMQVEGDQVHGVCGETVKAFYMRGAGQELGCETAGDWSQLALASGPAYCMPRRQGIWDWNGDRMQEEGKHARRATDGVCRGCSQGWWSRVGVSGIGKGGGTKRNH